MTQQRLNDDSTWDCKALIEVFLVFFYWQSISIWIKKSVCCFQGLETFCRPKHNVHKLIFSLKMCKVNRLRILHILCVLGSHNRRRDSTKLNQFQGWLSSNLFSQPPGDLVFVDHISDLAEMAIYHWFNFISVNKIGLDINYHICVTTK